MGNQQSVISNQPEAIGEPRAANGRIEALFVSQDAAVEMLRRKLRSSARRGVWAALQR